MNVRTFSLWVSRIVFALLVIGGTDLHNSTAQAPSAVDDGSRSASSPAASVPGLENKCVDSDSDDQGLLFIVNHCSVPVEIMWFFGQGNQSVATLPAGNKISTGTTGADIPRLGVLRYFACPSTHPVISDSGGRYLTAPTDEYHCEFDTARISNSTAPRAFSYDVLTSGDCVLQKGLLTFNAKGEGKWRASIHTNHTTNRDIWHISFEVEESNGRSLFPVPLGDSPAMYGSPSPTIPWAVDFNFDPAKFKFIDHVTVRTSC